MTSPVDSDTNDLMGRVTHGQLGTPLSRRLFLVGTTVGVAAVGLTACGGEDSPTGSTSATGSTNFPVTLAGKEGTATIPAEPQRVIALGFQRDADTVLALDVRPIAMAEHSIFSSGIAPWVEPELTDPKPELLNTVDGIPFEKIAALRPDLILATDSYELTGNYTRLAQIAPTVSYLEGPEGDTWQQRTTLIGRALGREEQAQKLITDIEAKITQAAQDNPTFAGKTFSRSYVAEGQIRAILGEDAAVALLEQLGLKIAPEVAAQPQSDTPGRAILSLENISVLNADVMMISYTTDSDRTFLESSPLFQQLDAVKNGNYVRVEQQESVALSFPSSLSIPYGLDRTVTAIANVLR